MLNTAYIINSANLNVLIGTTVMIIFALNAIQYALIAKVLFQINALVVLHQSFFLNNSAFLNALMAII